ncbi:hypothetical protein ACSN4Y_002308, partial [Salmonella enterica subsp. enterica serovar Montevideo]
MSIDIDIIKARAKNEYRLSKVRGEAMISVRIPGGILPAHLLTVADAPRDKCTLSCAINGIHAAFHYLKKNYISGCVMTVPTG